MKFLSDYFHIFILVTHNRDVGFTFGVWRSRSSKGWTQWSKWDMAQSVNDSIHVNTQRTIMQHPKENDLRDSSLFSQLKPRIETSGFYVQIKSIWRSLITCWVCMKIQLYKLYNIICIIPYVYYTIYYIWYI